MENVRWKTEIPGKGWSSPVIDNDTIWLTTGIVHSISREELARRRAELKGNPVADQMMFDGALSLHAIGVDADTGIVRVQVDPRYFRPTEVESLLGDPSRARERLGWRPRVDFGRLVAEMVAADLELARRDSLCEQQGFRTPRYFE